LNHSELGRRLRLVLITSEDLAGTNGVVNVVQQALSAGAPSIQLRAKEATARELTAMVQGLIPAVRAAGSLLFVNDRLDVALAAGADGVHLGPDDLPVRDVRSAVDDDFIVGYSTDDPADAAQAQADGADYLGSGTVYATTNKSDPGEVIGVEGLRRVVEAVSIPVVGIGGITPERAEAVAETGASGIAVIGAVMSAADPGDAVRRLMAPFG
jgi:thiamine-phosphate pyrophosphorylase